MLRNVYLYGDLAEKYGKKHTFDVSSVAESIRALSVNFKGFIKSIKRDGSYQVVNGEDIDNGKSLFEEELKMIFNKGDFHIVPITEGSSGLVRTVLGVALIVVGVYTEQPWLVSMGISMAIGGVASMLSPTPNINNYGDRESPDERPSFLFDGPVNTIEQGGPVPIAYGRVMVGSTVVSSAIQVEDI